MPGPTTRVLALLELLQTHGRLSGAEIAARLEVDRRTVRRYITALEDLGIPVTAEQGRHGGYLLVPGFKLPPMMFTDEEALVLALGMLAVSESELLDTGAAVHSAQAKLERVMPEPLKRRLRAIREHTQVIPRDGRRAAQRTVLMALTEAAQARQRVRMTYRSPRGDTMQRELDPYGLVFRDRHWYVTGHCPLRQALRSFRLDRLSGVELHEQHFQRPAQFNAAEHLQTTLRDAWRGNEVSVLLHTDVAAATASMGEFPGLLEQQPDGVLLTTSTDSHQWFAWWLMRLPFRFSIVAPVELKDAMRHQAERLLASCD